DVNVYEWVGSGGSDDTLNHLTVPGDLTVAIVNPSSTPSPWPYAPSPTNSFPPRAFIEGGMNVSRLLGLPAGACPSFTTFLANTRSSPSVNSTLQDFVL